PAAGLGLDCQEYLLRPGQRDAQARGRARPPAAAAGARQQLDFQDSEECRCHERVRARAPARRRCLSAWTARTVADSVSGYNRCTNPRGGMAMRRRLALLLFGLAATLAVYLPAASQADAKTYYWISHGSPADPVWTYFLAGAKQWAQDTGNTVNTSFH